MTVMDTERMLQVRYIESFLFLATVSLSARYFVPCDFKIQISHPVHVCASYSLSILGTVGSKRYGIAKNVNLIAVKVLRSGGSGSWAGVIAGINWVVSQPRLNGAVINMSLGAGYVYKPINDAVEAAVQAGVHVVVSAGNSDTDACGVSPASAVNAITVGATGQDDAKASFSNYGGCLDMFAPGVAIESTYIRNGWYCIHSGTSMAAPHSLVSLPYSSRRTPPSPLHSSQIGCVPTQQLVS
jgi:hypothetical protein